MTLQVIRGFRELHAAAPKKWLERRIKEDAVHTGDQWVVKAEVLRAFGEQPRVWYHIAGLCKTLHSSTLAPVALGQMHQVVLEHRVASWVPSDDELAFQSQRKCP